MHKPPFPPNFTNEFIFRSSILNNLHIVSFSSVTIVYVNCQLVQMPSIWMFEEKKCLKPKQYETQQTFQDIWWNCFWWNWKQLEVMGLLTRFIAKCAHPLKVGKMYLVAKLDSLCTYMLAIKIKSKLAPYKWWKVKFTTIQNQCIKKIRMYYIVVHNNVNR